MIIITMVTTSCARACGLSSLVVCFNVKTRIIWNGNVTIRSDVSVQKHMFLPNVSIYKRRSDIKEDDVTEFRLYLE